MKSKVESLVELVDWLEGELSRARADLVEARRAATPQKKRPLTLEERSARVREVLAGAPSSGMSYQEIRTILAPEFGGSPKSIGCLIADMATYGQGIERRERGVYALAPKKAE